jgi:hypothetical protein
VSTGNALSLDRTRADDDWILSFLWDGNDEQSDTSASYWENMGPRGIGRGWREGRMKGIEAIGGEMQNENDTKETILTVSTDFTAESRRHFLLSETHRTGPLIPPRPLSSLRQTNIGSILQCFVARKLPCTANEQYN